MERYHKQMIQDYLFRLGFGEQAAKIFLVLVEQGPMSLLQISRLSGIERTRLYRVIEDLTEKGLVIEQLAFKSRRFEAADLEQLRKMVSLERTKAEQLTQNWDSFAALIEETRRGYSPTRVLYFKGAEGIKQMSWNSLQAKGELLSYVYRAFQEAIGQKYLNDWAREAKASNVKIRELHSERFQESLHNGLFFSVDLRDMGKRYDARLLPSKIMSMTHAMDIYNDVVGIIYWKEEEVFGIEIHNEMIAQMQRSIFEVFWKMANKYKY